MPTFLQTPPAIAEKLKAKGLNADDYVFDPDASELVPRDEALKAGTAWDTIKEVGKQGIKGAISAVPDTMELQGASKEAMGQFLGLPRGLGGNDFALAKGIKSLEDKYLPENVTVNPIYKGLGAMGGNLASLLIPGGMAMKGEQVAAKVLPKLLPKMIAGLGGAQMAGQTIEEELANQEKEGRFDPNKALVKGGSVGAVGTLLSHFLGSGKIASKLASEAAPEGSAIVRRLADVVSGGLAGGGTEAAKVGALYGPGGIVTPEGASRIGTASAVGAIGQPIAGGLAEFGNPVRERTSTQEPMTPAEPPKIEAPYEYPANVRDSLVAQAARGDKKIKSLIADPVTDAINLLHSEKVPISPELINELATVYSGKKENAKAVAAKANEIFHEFTQTLPPEIEPQAEVLKQKLAPATELLEARAVVDKLGGQIDGLKSKVAKMPPGTAWLSETQQQLRMLEQQYQEAQQHVSNLSRTMDMGEKTPTIPEGGNVEQMGLPFEASEPAGAELSRPNFRLPPDEGSTIADMGGLAALLDPNAPTTPALPGEEGMLPFQQSPGAPVPTELTSLNEWIQQNPNFRKSIRIPFKVTEGEQGLPFTEQKAPNDNTTVPKDVAPVKETPSARDKNRPTEFYSGLPTKQILESLRKIGILPKGFRFDKSVASIAEAGTTTLAKRGPSAAWLAYKTPELFQEKDRLANKGMVKLAEKLQLLDVEKGQINPERAKFKDPRFIEWLNNATDNQTWSTEGLPKELKDTAEFVKELILDPHREQRAANVGVERLDEAGNRTVTLPEDVEGYFPHGISDAARRARRDGGPAWETIKNAWFRDWAKRNNTDSDNWRATAYDALLGAFGETFAPGNATGEPLFSAVRRAHGIPIPREMRSNDPVRDLENYYRKYSADVAYGKVIQHDPVGRALLGLKEDPMGIDTTESDPKTWADAPQAWEQAVMEGRRQGAEWAETADPKRPPMVDIHPLANDDLMKTWMASYRQVPMGGIHSQTISAAQQLASSALLQTFSGLRDVGTATVNTLRDAGLRNTIHGIISTLQEGGLSRPLKAGAMQHDPFLAQMPVVDSAETGWHWFNRAMIKAARGIRAGTLRQMMDQYSRALGYNTVYEAIMDGHGQKYIDALGPVAEPNLTREQIAERTAARFSTMIANPADIRTLPVAMIPQTNSLISNFLALSRFGVSQFNAFYNQAYRPALKGNIGPLVRTLLGGTVAAAASGALINALTNSKPQHLTWAEWLKLPDDKDKAKEAFFTWTGYERALGSMGVVSDMLYPVAKGIAGGGMNLSDASPQNAGVIVGAQLLNKIQQYLGSWELHKDANWMDIPKLALEMAKSAQLVRGIANWGSEDQVRLRDIKTYERLTRLSAKSAEPLSYTSDARSQTPPDPFGLEKSIWAADDKEAWDALKPTLRKIYIDKGPEGMPQLSKWRQADEYYLWLAKTRSREEAVKTLERDEARDEEGEARKMMMEKVATEK